MNAGEKLQARTIFWINEPEDAINNIKYQCLQKVINEIDSNIKYIIKVKEEPIFENIDIYAYPYIPNFYEERKLGHFHEFQLEIMQVPEDHVHFEEFKTSIFVPVSFKDRLKKAWNILNNKAEIK